MRWSNDQLLDYQSRYLKKNNKDFARCKGEREVEQPDEGLENQLDKRIAKYIEEHGLYGFHDMSRGVNKAGHPDWVLSLPKGRTVYIENKSKKGKLRPEQEKVMVRLLGLGHEFYMCKSYKRFLDIVNGDKKTLSIKI
jgi:hypothetical protein